MSTKENQADVATRGADVQKLADNQIWWHGPKWLTGPESEWPGLPNDSHKNEDLEYESEIKKTKPEKGLGLLSTQTSGLSTYRSGACTPLGIKCETYSSITKMLRVSALEFRFINKLKNSTCREGPISSAEIDEMEIMWLTFIQKRNFADVFDTISNRKSNDLQRQLGVHLDDDGLLHC